LLLIFFPQAVKRPADTLYGNVIRRVHLGDILNLSRGKSCCAGHRDAANPGVGSGRDVEHDVHLLSLRLGLLLVADVGLVVAVLLHQLFDAA